MGSLGIAWDKSGCETVGREMSFRNVLQAEDGWFMCWSTRVPFPYTWKDLLCFWHEGILCTMEDKNSDVKSHKCNEMMHVLNQWLHSHLQHLSIKSSGCPSRCPPPNMDSILLRMEQTGEWVSSSLFWFFSSHSHLRSIHRILKGIVSLPDSSNKAELLLETAQAEFKLRRIQKQLANQQVQCNLLWLEYSHLQVEWVEQHLLEAEGHVGRARLVMRQCGYSSGSSSELGHNGINFLPIHFSHAC